MNISSDILRTGMFGLRFSGYIAVQLSLRKFSGQPRTLLKLKLFGILTINLFLT
jgi:hypothetical protein